MVPVTRGCSSLVSPVRAPPGSTLSLDVIVQAAQALKANGLALYEERPDGSRLVIAPADTLTALGRPDGRPLAPSTPP
jgi:hypothetical protein